MKVSVSILKEKNNYKEAIDKINNTRADYIHLDIMDGTFTKSSSFELSKFKNISNKKYDIHLMSTNLDQLINESIKLNPEYITFHIESTKDIIKYINLIKENNIKVGLAINPKTKLYKLKKFINLIDMVLVMSVTPGEGGQLFKVSTIKKLRKLREKYKDITISVDGGINKETCALVSNYVDIVVSGSYITDSDDYDSKINELRVNH